MKAKAIIKMNNNDEAVRPPQFSSTRKILQLILQFGAKANITVTFMLIGVFTKLIDCEKYNNKQ